MTFDEARLMANVNDRAMRLFADGYRARWRDGSTLSVRSSKGEVYCLDTLTETCDCPFFQKHSGRHPCKHLLGRERLLARQRACRLLIGLTLLRVWSDLDDGTRLDDTDCPDDGTCDPTESRWLKPVQETEAAHADD